MPNLNAVLRHGKQLKDPGIDGLSAQAKARRKGHYSNSVGRIVPMEDALYDDLAAAYVRGMCPDAPSDTDNAALVEYGRSQGLKLHRFKRTAMLPRIRAVLGILRGLAPATLADIGSGRGVFLWPLLDAFPGLVRRDRAG